MNRTLSVRVEVVIDCDDTADAREVGERLARRAAEAIEASPRAREIRHAASVLRMQEAPRWG